MVRTLLMQPRSIVYNAPPFVCPALDTTMAPTPRMRDEGHDKSRHRSFPRGIPRALPDQRINRQFLLSLELAGNLSRRRPIQTIRRNRPTTILHALLPTLQVRTVRV